MLGIVRNAFIACVLCGQLAAAGVEILETKVHEAFMTPVTDSVVLQAIATQPPRDIQERIPDQKDPRSIWIPGYWAYDAARHDFVWVGGVHRRPPPGHEWIAGLWKQFPEGYVYIPGFWSAAPEEQLQYISLTPPDALEEKGGKSPGDNYFFAKGHWTFDEGTQSYNWLGGRYEKFDSNWIFVPAQYVWRPNGYVFIDSHWDWKLEDRGTAYASLYLPGSLRPGYVYQPVRQLRADDILQSAFLEYPNHLYTFLWHHHFHPEFWISFHQDPPWWGWRGWWTLNWSNQWALFWWWTHPGYAMPRWIHNELAAKIAPPSKTLVGEMKGVTPPSIVLPTGVVSEQALVDALPHKNQPILPASANQLRLITGKLERELPSLRYERPTGRITPQIAHMDKPDFPAKYRAKQLALAAVPGKPVTAEGTDTYRARPESDEERVKPVINQPVFPSRRPKLSTPPSSTIQRDLFKPETAPQTQPRQEYRRQEVPKQSPYEEQRYRYEPVRPKYEAPRDGMDYKPSDYQPMRSPSIPGDIYAPPASSTYAPTESIRTPSRRGFFRRPSVDTETNWRGEYPEEAKEPNDQ